MNEKHEFFKAYYAETFAMRNRIRGELLELTKLNILFYGVFFFFLSKRQQLDFIIDCTAPMNWYHLILLLAFLTLITITILLANGLLPVPTKYIASPKELSEHWDKLDTYCNTDGVEANAIDILHEHMVEQYTDSAGQNDTNNVLISKFKEYASYLIYLNLFWFYVLVSILYLGSALGITIFVVILIIAVVISIKRDKLNGR